MTGVTISRARQATYLFKFTSRLRKQRLFCQTQTEPPCRMQVLQWLPHIWKGHVIAARLAHLFPQHLTCSGWSPDTVVTRSWSLTLT